MTYKECIFSIVYTSEDLHLCTFKTPPSGERGDADCAFQNVTGIWPLKIKMGHFNSSMV